jgi:hypothetical protein
MHARMKRALIGLMAVSMVGIPAITGLATSASAVTGAGFTSVDETVDGTGHCANGNPNNNCNIYDGKQYVWLNGGPTTAYVGDGDYFFAVLSPGGQADPNDGAPNNLSDDFDAYTNRTFSVSGAAVTYGGTHDPDGNKIRLADYADTTNPGGVYVLAVCSLAGGYPVGASSCKYDAFKVSSEPTPAASDLTIVKDADGAYDNTYTWGITKDVDKTKVTQVGGSATFNYTVKVTHDAGTISDVTVSGTISVFNPNVDDNNATVPVDITGVSDQLSDGTVCTVTNGGAQTLTLIQTDFAYSCSLSSLPQGELDNTASVAWDEQLLDNGALLVASSADFTFPNISFSENAIDECVNVTDKFVLQGNTGTADTVGQFCVGGTKSGVAAGVGATYDSGTRTWTLTYSRTVAVPAHGCLSYDNTAKFTTTDTETMGSASQTVTVCGPLKTGALTMGFWQNKNGQGIITGQSKTGVCASGTWLRQYAPFQDLSATATCAQVATYVTNVIKAANASGAAMNVMLKAQMLSTALDVYFSDPALGGNKIGAASPIGGIAIDLTKVCANPLACSSYINASPAFGGATSMTVSQILSYASSQSNAGGTVWYGQVKATQEKAKDTFDAINNEVAFGA